jgi:processive 1,2-diacylglycerol beta-glucosyltransferase
MTKQATRVLITTITTRGFGKGNENVARAIEKAYKLTGDVEVKLIDYMDSWSYLEREAFVKQYAIELETRIHDLGRNYDKNNHPWQEAHHDMDDDTIKDFTENILEFQPDTIVSTHCTPAQIISNLRQARIITASHAIVVPDFEVFGANIVRNCDHWFLPFPENKAHLQTLGVEETRLTVSGIPIDPVYAENKDKMEMRKRHGLHQDRLTILVSGGGDGVGVDRLRRSLMEMFKLKQKAQIIVVCGHSNKLMSMATTVAEALANEHISIMPVGFTKHMDELMSAADVYVGKPGGLTSSEVLAKGLPFVIVDPLQGAETRNADHLLEQGAAIRCNTPATLAWKIEELVNDRLRRCRMKRNALRLARPNAALDIVRKLNELTPLPPVQTPVMYYVAPKEPPKTDDKASESG